MIWDIEGKHITAGVISRHGTYWVLLNNQCKHLPLALQNIAFVVI